MTDPARIIEPAKMLEPVRRPRYFEGRLLSAADLVLEQEYHRGMRHLQNRALGWGIVEGLDVRVTRTGLVVDSGFAIDALGRELVVSEPVVLPVDDTLLQACPDAAVTATWDQVPEGPVPGGDSGGTEFAYWLETPRIVIEPASGVRSPTLVLARVRRRKKKNGLAVDLTARDGFRLRA
jgi:hypothetical protein